MAKRNKQQRSAKGNTQPQVQQTAQPQKEDPSVERVEQSVNLDEFNQNRKAYLQKFYDDVAELEKERTSATEAAETAKAVLTELETKKSQLSAEKAELEQGLKAVEKEYEQAVNTIDSANVQATNIISAASTERDEIIAQAESDAKEKRTAADQDYMSKIAEASAEAQEIWKKQIESLKAQLSDVAKRERELSDAQIKLEKDLQDFELEKEELEELRSHVMKLKERYAAASPAKIQDLNIELSDEKSKYELLKAKYDELSKRFEEAQVILDTLKTEIDSSTGERRISSASEIVSAMHDFKERYEKLLSLNKDFPDFDSIAKLRDKADKTDKLEAENNTLIQERDRYRVEAVAARNAVKALEVVRQEVEATNALNEHLLQELESHKTALESRTGDTCPSLSKVDVEVDEVDFCKDIQQRMQRQPIATLKEVVSHVKNYAGSRKKDERLFFTDNDIRAFLAGMAVSRLIILQGMSGTGKSSLPRIFSEAISGFNRLIPVESSWRDRNELLGYYNDFNKKFNAKSFTIELYRSSKKKCQEIPTLIVLDEMNLARIEYYFSDFLAILQEPDHNKWLIELVSSDMRTLPMELPEEVKQRMKRDEPTAYEIWEKIERSRQGDLHSETSDEEKELLTAYLAKLEKLTGAKDLIAGRKIKVTDNIWFVGTANQDESTFEISDKVYDRAQVVSLNKKGKSEGNYANTNSKFISVTDLLSLFESAITNFKQKDEVESRLDALDNILVEKFDISFGNRIVMQTVDFAAVFVAAGGSVETALDYQISTKILRKVLTRDDGEAFLELSEAAKDYPETKRLIEKRIKELR